jgi:hypothetical protein
MAMPERKDKNMLQAQWQRSTCDVANHSFFRELQLLVSAKQMAPIA